jgi:hypothetical protein
MQNHGKKFFLGKVAIVSAVLTGFLAGPGAPLLRADHCWNKEHKWWDEDGHRWHTEHDWDPNDHH